VLHGGRYLVDGGVVDPLPVDIARAEGATHVIAVDVSVHAAAFYHHVKTRRAIRQKEKKAQRDKLISRIIDVPAVPERLKAAVKERLGSQREVEIVPSMLDIIFQTIYIMESEIVRAKLVESPADLVIRPRIDTVSATDFERAEEIVRVGEAAAIAAMPHVRKIVGGER